MQKSGPSKQKPKLSKKSEVDVYSTEHAVREREREREKSHPWAISQGGGGRREQPSRGSQSRDKSLASVMQASINRQGFSNMYVTADTSFSLGAWRTLASLLLLLRKG